MELLVYQALLVPPVDLVHQESEARRVTLVSSVFQVQPEKRVLRVISDCQVRQGRLGWRGSQVPWDQLDLQDLLGHQGHRTALVTWMDTRATTASLVSPAHLDHRVQLVFQVCLVGQVCQVITETKEQRDREDLLGCQVWTGSQDSRVRREREERKERRVRQGETVGYLDLQGLPDLQDKPSTRRVTIMTYIGTKGGREDMVSQVVQDSQGPLDQKEKKETPVLQDMHLKGRKESLVSSWGLMGDLSTSVVWQDGRVTVDPLDLRDLQVHMVLQARRERLGFQVDRVGRG